MDGSFYASRQDVTNVVQDAYRMTRHFRAQPEDPPALPEINAETPTGTSILDGAGRVIKHNPTMGCYIHRANGLEINDTNCLLVVDEYDRRHMYVDQLLHGSHDSKLNQKDPEGRAIPEFQEILVRNYQISTTVITWNMINYYLLVVVDKLEKIRVLCKQISNQHGLTPAETDVFFHVICGRNNKSIALLRNVSAETIKSQMLSILGKTGSASRGELTRDVLLKAI